MGRPGEAGNRPTGPSRCSIGGGKHNAGFWVRDGSTETSWETGETAGDELSRVGGGAEGEDSTELILLPTAIGESESGSCTAEGREGGA